MRYLCQNMPKTEAEYPHRPPGSSSSPPKFASGLIIKNKFTSKHGHAQTFGQITPLVSYLVSYTKNMMRVPRTLVMK